MPMYRKSLLILLLILIAVAGGTYYGCYTQEKEAVQLDVAANPAVQQGGGQMDGDGGLARPGHPDQDDTWRWAGRSRDG